MLAVDLDRQSADLAKQSGGNRRSSDERTASAVGLEGTPQDQRLPVVRLDPLLGQQCMDGMIGRQLDLGGDRGGVFAASHEPRVRARTERQPQCIEQDRLARAGLASEYAQSFVELELELLDEHDVADCELPQHGAPAGKCISSAERSAANAAK
jgi:hypothetical protein